MTAKPRSAQYTAFHREMKTLAAAAAASAAAETAPPVACSIACQTEGGDQELALPVACPTEDSARDSASGEAGPPAKKANTVIIYLKKFLRRLRSRNFQITVVHGDNEFNVDSIKDACVPSKFHICSKNEHIPVIERSIRTVKERARYTSHYIPYV